MGSRGPHAEHEHRGKLSPGSPRRGRSRPGRSSACGQHGADQAVRHQQGPVLRTPRPDPPVHRSEHVATTLPRRDDAPGRRLRDRPDLPDARRGPQRRRRQRPAASSRPAWVRTGDDLPQPPQPGEGAEADRRQDRQGDSLRGQRSHVAITGRDPQAEPRRDRDRPEGADLPVRRPARQGRKARRALRPELDRLVRRLPGSLRLHQCPPARTDDRRGEQREHRLLRRSGVQPSDGQGEASGR